MYETDFLPFCGNKSTSRVSPSFEVAQQKVHVLILFAGKTNQIHRISFLTCRLLP